MMFHEASLQAMGSSGMNSQSGEPYLQILIQPSKEYRFRYPGEGESHGGITGEGHDRNQRVYPAVRIHNYNGDAKIIAELVTEGYQDHVHKFVGKTCKNGKLIRPCGPGNMTVDFPDLRIQHTKKKDVAKILEERYSKKEEEEMNHSMQGQELYVPGISEDRKRQIQDRAVRDAGSMDLSTVIIKFTAHLVTFGRTNMSDPPILQTHVIGPVYSNPVTRAKPKLKITYMLPVSGSVEGEEMCLFCEKVHKDDIEIVFYQADSTGQVTWREEGIFQQSDVHHQYAIKFKAPAYHANDIKHPVPVFVLLRRKSDGEESAPHKFLYKPADILGMCEVEKKRKCQPSYWHTNNVQNTNVGHRNVTPRVGAPKLKNIAPRPILVKGQGPQHGPLDPTKLFNMSGFSVRRNAPSTSGFSGSLLAQQQRSVPNPPNPGFQTQQQQNLFGNPLQSGQAAFKMEAPTSQYMGSFPAQLQHSVPNPPNAGFQPQQQQNLFGNPVQSGQPSFAKVEAPSPGNMQYYSASSPASSGRQSVPMDANSPPAGSPMQEDQRMRSASQQSGISSTGTASQGQHMHSTSDNYLGNLVDPQSTYSFGSPGLNNGNMLNKSQSDPGGMQGPSSVSNAFSNVSNQQTFSNPGMPSQGSGIFMQMDQNAADVIPMAPVQTATIQNVQASTSYQQAVVTQGISQSAAVHTEMMQNTYVQTSGGVSVASMQGTATVNAAPGTVHQQPGGDIRMEPQENLFNNVTGNADQDFEQLLQIVLQQQQQQQQLQDPTTRFITGDFTLQPDGPVREKATGGILRAGFDYGRIECDSVVEVQQTEAETETNPEDFALGMRDHCETQEESTQELSEEVEIQGKLSEVVTEIKKSIEYFSTSGNEQALISGQDFFLEPLDSWGNNCLHLAVIYGLDEILQSLLALMPDLGPDFIEVHNYAQYTPLHLAVMWRNNQAVTRLTNAGASPLLADSSGDTSIHMACCTGEADIMEILLKSAQNHNELFNYEGLTPLHLLASGTFEDVCRCITILLKHKHDVDSGELKKGQTALHVATEENNIIVARYLLTECNADANACGFDGTTALHIAAAKDHKEIAILLRAFGADNITNDGGCSPLDMASSEEMRRILQEDITGYASDIRTNPCQILDLVKELSDDFSGLQVANATEDENEDKNGKNPRESSETSPKDEMKVLTSSVKTMALSQEEISVSEN